MYHYKCPLCGFSHQVPAYWTSFQEKPTFEFMHMSFATKEMCDNPILELKRES